MTEKVEGNLFATPTQFTYVEEWSFLTERCNYQYSTVQCPHFELLEDGKQNRAPRNQQKA